MHPLHDYIAGQLTDRLKERSVIIFYDPRSEMEGFFDELRAGETRDYGLSSVRIGGRLVKLVQYVGSYLEVRWAAERAAGNDDPDEVLVYLPGVTRDEHGSLLMEVEKAGLVYERPLKHMARPVLKRRFTDVEIDEILRSENLTYADLAKIAQASANGENASILRSLFDNTSDTLTILVRWILNSATDVAIQEKGAVAELRKLAEVRLGLSFTEDTALPKARSIALRHVLGNEFMLDLNTEEVSVSLPGLTPPTTRDQEHAIREVARRLRVEAPDAYEALADQAASELGIEKLPISGDALGSIDTFRSEERLVIARCFELIADRRFSEAGAILDARQASYWVNRDKDRTLVWSACRFMIDLGIIAGEVEATLAKANGTPSIWFSRYTEPKGWHRLDRAQRELEAIIAACEEHVDERALVTVRQTYEDVCDRMASGFVKALDKNEWSVAGGQTQIRIFADLVAPRPKPVAYILVDALRYEMGVELSERIAKLVTEMTVTPAIGALPSITPIGMAALQPGASSTFSVGERNGKLGAEIDGTFLADLKARQNFAKGMLPSSVDLTLDTVFQGNIKSLKTKIGDAQVIFVRSQEIDEAGEGASSFARRVMGGVIEDLARCLSRLASAGVEHAVITADHGHLFFGQDRAEAMRIDAPGGATVDLHRRCWVGRGGATPPGTVRVSAARLGYASDLDFVFPLGAKVFKAGGDLAYHHGGPSLQEMIVPVLGVRLQVEAAAVNEKNALQVAHDDVITNRVFTVRIELGNSLFSAARSIRPTVVSGDRQVALMGMSDPPKEPDGSLRLEPRKTAMVGFLLRDDDAKSVRIQILDGDTDAVLYSSKEIPVRLGV
ncbi:PglZ domain-containing protein [Microvirga tunisiensis]|uniref:PglZ domain-containing protein n=1 Tax=Microvirga tunisiensis TaxID=2108360 RepID=A0A5N7MAX1_9HYPH|nr:PglZ domain-containing protein [Microvirga tunisiensis]MPR06286.1 PglZ domain-containing protein [Microvirga tunisiensis]MPR24072.1 PglZ domain-containing protein [Microvirga tunisiensis]